MNDLIDRLRLRMLVQHGGPHGMDYGWNLHEHDSELHREAADEIERLRAAFATERDRCAMEVWYKRQAFEASPDDDGVIHWLQEAERAIRALPSKPPAGGTVSEQEHVELLARYADRFLR